MARFALFRKKDQTPRPKKSSAREWLDSMIFAVVAATLIRWLTLEAFAVPTPSMEGSVMVGDFLFVSKLHYGARTPKTPLQIPLTHQKIWGTDIPSFSEAIQLPQFRLPGFSEVKPGDVVVFNYPPVERGKRDYPTDLKTYYVKRCVGLPGERLSIRNQQVVINGKPLPLPHRAQTSYLIRTKETLNERFFRKYGIVNDLNSEQGPFINWQPVEAFNEATKTSESIGYQVYTSPEIAAKLKQLDWIQSVEPMIEPPGQAGPGIYGSAALPWNRDNFGPLTIPKKGTTVAIDRQTIAFYGPVIERYEGNRNVQLTSESITIDGKPIRSYTFRQDYYFMMGDNRHNSEDSRYWGFVPADHVVGKAVFVWMSLDPAPADLWHKVRWNRLFRPIE